MYFIHQLEKNLGNYLHADNMKTEGTLGGGSKIARGKKKERPKGGGKIW